MADLVKKRGELKALRDLCDHVHGRIGFKIIKSSLPLPLDTWKWLGRDVAEKTSPFPVEASDNWVDPFVNTMDCIWWWGQRKIVDKFCEWADETAIGLREYREFLHQPFHGKGYFGTLDTFCSIGLKSDLLEQRVLLDVNMLNARQRQMVPSPLRISDPPPVCQLLDVPEDAITFSRSVLDYLLETVPRLVVDVATNTAHWKGQPYPLSGDQAIILDLLLKNLDRGSLTAKQMISTNSQLAGVHFNRTMRQNLPKPLRDLVKSKPGSGWYLDVD